jgi:putative FmdB family regulatory protein
MPLYEYQCDDCGVRFERAQRVSEDPVRECPECGGHVRRLFQPVGIIFKGSGFYCTDNRSKSSGSGSASSSHSNGSSKPPEKASASESTTSGESKTGSESK